MQNDNNLNDTTSKFELLLYFRARDGFLMNISIKFSKMNIRYLYEG
jgi:hypothetical protein